MGIRASLSGLAGDVERGTSLQGLSRATRNTCIRQFKCCKILKNLVTFVLMTSSPIMSACSTNCDHYYQHHCLHAGAVVVVDEYVLLLSLVTMPSINSHIEMLQVLSAHVFM